MLIIKFQAVCNRLARALAMFALAALVSACMNVQFVPAYDEQIDTGLTQLYADTSAFVDRMIAARGTPEGTLARNQDFYTSSIGKVDSLMVRAEAHKVLDNCPSTKLMARVLDSAGLPAEVRGAIGTPPQGECQIVLLRLIRTGFDTMRQIHEIQGADGFPPSAHGQFIDGGVGAQLRAAITVEIAKRAQ